MTISTMRQCSIAHQNPVRLREVTSMRLHLLTAVPFILSVGFVQAQTLPQAMQQAMDVHPEVQAGVNARIAQDYNVRAAKGGYLPRVHVTAGYGRAGSGPPSPRAIGGNNDWAALNRGGVAVRLLQVLFVGL